MTMRPYASAARRNPIVRKFTLNELVLLLTCCAITSSLMAQGVALLGFSFLATVIAFRTSVVDFSIVGDLAVLLTILFGSSSIWLLILWSLGA